MSSMITSQGVVLATAMAVSGTVIVLALRLQRSFLATQFPLHEISQPPSTPILRSCISSVGNRRKKKKSVHFADDVVDSCGDGEEFRRHQQQRVNRNSLCSKVSESSKVQKNCDGKSDVIRGMPANRKALYNGILRDRVAQRITYSY